MTQSELKELKAIGAELGAAKAEVVRLREALHAIDRRNDSMARFDSEINAIVRAALSQQAEPTDTYTAVDMATAAAQGFRDGQAAVEQAAAQDERDVVATVRLVPDTDWKSLDFAGDFDLQAQEIGTKLYRRPAQTKQQPVSWQFYQDGKWWNGGDRIKDHRKNTEAAGIPVRDLYAAPIAQTAQRGEA